VIQEEVMVYFEVAHPGHFLGWRLHFLEVLQLIWGRVAEKVMKIK
jgi:hypothetical protein